MVFFASFEGSRYPCCVKQFKRLILVIIWLAVGCRPVETPLVDTQWRLVRYRTQGEIKTAVPGNLFHLTFTETDIKGHTGCNQFDGLVTYRQFQKVHIAPFQQTTFDCPGSFLRLQAQVVMPILQNATSYEFVQPNLRLLTADGDEIEFEAVTNDQDVFLPDRNLINQKVWELVAIENSGGVLPTVPGPAITLIISEEDASGFAGCNDYAVTPIFMVADAFILQLEKLSHSLMSCGFALDEQERIFFDILRQSETFILTNDTLELVSRNGKLTFQLAEE